VTFPTGHYEYDPIKLGYRTDIKEEDPEYRETYDTSKSGNRNTGHLYGTGLTDEQRWELLEYIKTL
jgi:hypothetical protein